MGLVLVELAGFGFGLNPAIGAELASYEPPVIARLRQESRAGGRVLSDRRGVTAECAHAIRSERHPQLRLGRAGEKLAMVRAACTTSTTPSRAEARSHGTRAREPDLLRESGVYAVVAAAPPPEGSFARLEQVGRVWVAWLDGLPLGLAESAQTRLVVSRDDGRADIRIGFSSGHQPESLRETFDPGWIAMMDGRADRNTAKSQRFFLHIEVPSRSA